MLSNLRINTKMILSILISSVAGVLIAVCGTISMQKVDDQNRFLYDEQVEPMSYLEEVHASELKSRLDLHRIALAATPEDRKKRREGLQETDDELAEATAGYKRTSSLANSAAMRQYETNWAKYLEVRDSQLLPLAMSGDTVNFSKLMADVAAPIISDAADGIDKLVDLHAKAAKQSADDANRAHRSGTIAIVLVTLIGIGLSAAFSQFVAARLVGPLRRVSGVLDSLANGDLTNTTGVKGQDEIGRMAEALDRAITRTHEVVKAVGANMAKLAGAAGQTTSINGEIAERAAETTRRSQDARAAAHEVSNSVQTVASATEEMRASIAEIASSSSQAASVAQEAVEVARTTNETISRLGASSAEIDSVVKVITSIAEQTNLLALNATIEAARAGDAGKGFAVVAGEVKDLAQETAHATDDIVRQVNAIQTDTSSAVSAIGQIVRIVDRIAQYQATIAAAVDEQTASAGEIGRNLMDATEGSAQIAGNMETVSTAASATNERVSRAEQTAGELNRMSGELQTLVAQFRY